MHNKNPIYQEFEVVANQRIKNINSSLQHQFKDWKTSDCLKDPLYREWEAVRNTWVNAKMVLRNVIHEQQGCGKKKDKPKTEKCGHE
jgi:hypothetical protein